MSRPLVGGNLDGTYRIAGSHEVLGHSRHDRCGPAPHRGNVRPGGTDLQSIARWASQGLSGLGAVGFALEMQSLGMTWANADLIARHQAPIFCLPPQPALTQQKLIEIFRRTIQDVPTLGERPFGMALLIAF